MFYEGKKEIGLNVVVRFLRERLISVMRFINVDVLGDLDKSSCRGVLGLKGWLRIYKIKWEERNRRKSVSMISGRSLVEKESKELVYELEGEVYREIINREIIIYYKMWTLVYFCFLYL